MLQPSTKSRVQINAQRLEIERLRRNTVIIEAGRLWDDTVSNRSMDKDEDQTGEVVQWNLMLVTVTMTKTMKNCDYCSRCRCSRYVCLKERDVFACAAIATLDIVLIVIKQGRLQGVMEIEAYATWPVEEMQKQRK